MENLYEIRTRERERERNPWRCDTAFGDVRVNVTVSSARFLFLVRLPEFEPPTIPEKQVREAFFFREYAGASNNTLGFTQPILDNEMTDFDVN